MSSTELFHDGFLENKRIVLTKAIKEYLRYLEFSLASSEHTLRAYRADLNSFSAWLQDMGYAIEDMDLADFRAYLAKLNQGGLSRRTINRKLSSLRGFLKFLVREGVLTDNPAQDLQSPKLERKLPKTISEKDFEALIAACDQKDPLQLRDRALFELFYASGARVSEISALNMCHVNTAQGELRLFGKGRKERIVPLHDQAIRVLLMYIEGARPQLSLCNKEAALFLSSRGLRLSADAIRKILKSYLVKIGADRSLSPHSFRHSFASDLLGGGADLRSVQELLGHESLSTTQIYTQVHPKRLREAVDRAHPRA